MSEQNENYLNNLSVDQLNFRSIENFKDALKDILNLEKKEGIIDTSQEETIIQNYEIALNRGKKEPTVFYAGYKNKIIKDPAKRMQAALEDINRITKRYSDLENKIFIDWFLNPDKNINAFSKAQGLKTILRLWQVSLIQYDAKGIFVLAGFNPINLKNAKEILKKDWQGRFKATPIIETCYIEANTWIAANKSQTQNK